MSHLLRIYELVFLKIRLPRISNVSLMKIHLQRRFKSSNNYLKWITADVGIEVYDWNSMHYSITEKKIFYFQSSSFDDFIGKGILLQPMHQTWSPDHDLTSSLARIIVMLRLRLWKQRHKPFFSVMFTGRFPRSRSWMIYVSALVLFSVNIYIIQSLIVNRWINSISLLNICRQMRICYC